MYDLLKFIDSPDIREYNRDTVFTPAEWAVLAAASMKRTVEEKIEALQYLLEHHQEDEFGEERVNIPPSYQINMPFREIVKKTAEIWKNILEDRYREEDVIYAVKLGEKGYESAALYGCDYLDDYRFFTSYKKAYAYLTDEKQEYLDDENLKEVETYGVIKRIRMEDGGSDRYLFDTDIRLTDIRERNDRVLCGDREPVSLLGTSAYRVFVPLPFQKGDIVRIESLFDRPAYGVVSRDWERPEKTEEIRMWMPLDTYDSSCEEFGYTDGEGGGILSWSVCPEEELPEEEQVLKLISDVRKGKLDFYNLLHKYGRRELDDLLKWRVPKQGDGKGKSDV